jgi:hypothetical protein
MRVMGHIRCKFCYRYVSEIQDGGRCKSCNIEYRTVMIGINKRYGRPIDKRFRDRFARN